MEDKELKIKSIDEKIQSIDARIDAINEEKFVNRKKEGISLEVFNELCDLKRAKNHYEREKYDILHGTHKVQINELERKVIYLSLSLSDAKERLSRASIFNEKNLKEEVLRLEYAINDLQAFIIELEDEDMKIEGKEPTISFTL